MTDNTLPSGHKKGGMPNFDTPLWDYELQGCSRSRFYEMII